MSKRDQFQTIAVLSVESDVVRFTVFSVDSGHKVSTSVRCLPLIKAGRPNDGRECDAASVRARDHYETDHQRRMAAAEAERSSMRGHVEQDPVLLWDAVQKVISEGVENLCRNGTPVTYIKTLAVTNEMSTLMAWDAATGRPLYNAVHWTDSRMANRGCTAAAAEWLCRWSVAVECAGSACRLGTVDAWLVWKLTAGKTYETDVTNASYTGLLNLATLDWDWEALRKRGVPEYAWPAVRRPGGKSGRVPIVLVGRLQGLSVHVTVARPSAALYAQSCTRPGHVSVTLGHGAAVALGVVNGPPTSRPPPDGPTPVVGYCVPVDTEDGRTRPVYAQLTVSTAPEVICWLRDNVSLVKSVDECMNVYSSARPAGSGRQLPCVVPAVNGLPYAPYGRGDACLLVCGLSERMGAEHLVAAAVDSVCYTVADMVRCVARRANQVHVDGTYGRYDSLLLRLADACDRRVVRRNHRDMACTGAARMAARVINTGYADESDETEFLPTCSQAEHEFSVEQWAKAVPRSYGWFRASDPKLDEYDVSLITGHSPSGYFHRVADFFTACVNEVVLYCKTF